MDRSRLLISLPLLAALGLAVLGGVACEKKPPPAAPVDAGAPAPPPSDTTPVVLTPLDDNLDSGTDAPPPKPHGPGRGGGNTNSARIKQCCNALRSQAKNMGASPEANIVVGIAAQCDLIAIQAVSGTAPEFAQIRQMLKGRTLPAACSGM